VGKGAHSQAAGHVERVGGADGRKAGRHLRWLLPLKSRAEYDAQPAAQPEATSAVQAARRVVATPKRVVASTKY